jgi:hypothetical protein
MSGGRPPFNPDDTQRSAVTMLAACGTRFQVIATHIGVDTKTLRRHFRKELSEGRQDANALVARSLFSQAIGGNVTAQIFWLKTRAGWKETSALEMAGPDGRPLNRPNPSMLGISWINGGPGLSCVPESAITIDDHAQLE